MPKIFLTTLKSESVTSRLRLEMMLFTTQLQRLGISATVMEITFHLLLSRLIESSEEECFKILLQKTKKLLCKSLVLQPNLLTAVLKKVVISTRLVMMPMLLRLTKPQPLFKQIQLLKKLDLPLLLLLLLS